MVNTYEDTLYLRDASNCPPDVPLKDWLILLSDFFDKYEGGQTIYVLEKDNKRLQEKNDTLNEELQRLTEEYYQFKDDVYSERIEKDMS